LFDTLLIVFTVSTGSALAATSVSRMIAILVALFMGYASLAFMLFTDYTPKAEMLAIVSFCLAVFGLCAEIAAVVRGRVASRTL
jgi:hypothetical protein